MRLASFFSKNRASEKNGRKIGIASSCSFMFWYRDFSLSRADIITVIKCTLHSFIEEMLMSGFLFKALIEKGKGWAIAISSCAFGLIHIVNLFGGADILYTIMQIIFACSFGFVCAVFVYKTNNIIPCIICHCLLDLVALFWTENANKISMILGVLILISLFYGIYLLKLKKFSK